MDQLGFTLWTCYAGVSAELIDVTDLLSDSTICLDHECPNCGVREHVTVERVVVGAHVVTHCHCRACGYSWHPEESPA